MAPRHPPGERRATADPTRRADEAAVSDPKLAQLISHLGFLGLGYLKKHLDQLLAWASREAPSHTELLEHLLAQEVASKLEARIERRVSTSRLPERKTLEAFDWAFQPSLDKSAILELARLDFVRRKEDVVITGKPGTGKSHILKAFGCVPASRASPCAMPVASISSTTSTQDLPTAPIPGASEPGPGLSF